MDWFPAALENTVVIPAAILCVLPVKEHLRISPVRLAALGIPFLLGWSALGGMVCAAFSLSGNAWLFPWLVVFALAFRKSTDLSGWKSVSVLLAVCGVLSCLCGVSSTVDAMYSPHGTLPYLGLPGALTYVALSWLFLFVIWYPATHAARWLLNAVEMPNVWYVFWVLPVVFVLINVYIQPEDYDTLRMGRMMVIYPVMSLVLLGLLLFFYLLFYLMAWEMAKTMQLTRENEILQMQTAQYRSLQKNMEETRRARHDLRQHFIALQGCVNSGSLQAVDAYVRAHLEGLPLESPLVYCKNFALNAVLHHYSELTMEAGIDLECSVHMDQTPVIPEPELCVLVGNLLENALEACVRLNPERDRTIRVVIRQKSASMLAITVDNPCPQPPQRQGDKLRSTKHRGLGFGTQSIQVIAEHYNGDARFEWREGMFYASVLLNP